MCSKVLNGHIILTDTSITTILAPEMTYTPKLRLLRAVCNYANKQGMYGVNMAAFECLGNDIKWPETTSKAISAKSMNKIAAIDRTLLTKREQLHLDLFLFSYYTGGMANVDVCNLTWDCIQDDKIIYERIKFPKTAKPINYVS